MGLNRHRSDIQLIDEIKPEHGEDEAIKEAIEVQGILDYAVLRNRNVIGLTADDNQQYYIVVKEGMDDLVKSYFNQLVRVKGITYDQRNIYPVDIQSV